MEKQVTCKVCNKRFTISGPVPTGHVKEVAQTWTCPNCKLPNEVSWPMDSGTWRIK
jgi:phage FluMu protein Com